MKKRIYDAAFAPSTGQSHHAHIGMYWWIDSEGSTGSWSREVGCDYVSINPKSVFTSEGDSSAWVEVYHYTNNPSIRWLQTDPDGKLKDNLLTLAKRHSQGLPNK